ncbi:MAG TPA: histidinol-phosphatase HisJ family protein [Spirochaetota bacterium]|nr:histidinol-phosphatase HisJ family protein [Spirochaetota bacterium]
MKGLADYHTHTPLCGHAEGSPDDFIRAAVRAGLSEIGFSDHAPLPAGLREGITMLPEQVEEYLSLVEAARGRHGDAIVVRTAMEVDFPFHDSFDRRYLTDGRIDYLIGSCHFIDGWGFDNLDHLHGFDHRDIDSVYDDYFAILSSLIAAGAFNIVGHFDLVKKFGHRARADHSAMVRRIAGECAARDVAIEINTSGLRKPAGEMYPSGSILSILFDEGVPLALGSDAHNPDEVAYEFARAAEAARKAGYRSISGFSRRRRYDIPL